MLKKIVFSLFSIFLVYSSVDLISSLVRSAPTEFSNWQIIGLSFLLNLYITGVLAFTGFVFPTHQLLPNSYYQIKHPKQLTLIYKLLGVAAFKWLLLVCYWGKEKNRKRYFNGFKDGLEQFDAQTRQSEFGHLAALLFILLVAVFVLAKGHIAVFLITTLINIIGNLYPIILQRHHRIQTERMKVILNKRNR